MIIRIIYFAALIVCSSCSTNIVDNHKFLEQRSPIANSLENKERYADALTQWKILQISYPSNKVVTDNIHRLELLISDRVIHQLEILDQAKANGNEDLQRNAYLKILALEPNNEIAKGELTKFEWKFAMQEASSKTANIKRYFIESQKEAAISIQITKFIEQGEKLIQGKKYQALLQLADKFKDTFPTHVKPLEYRILAYTKLAEGLQKQNDPVAAIAHYKQALAIGALNGDRLPKVRKKADELSVIVANRYLKLANKVFQSNLDEAIIYYEQSLIYQPKNVKTRKLMMRAKKIRQNLLKIKKLDSNSD